ncbi:hypothetical protein RIF23_20095 [Lipingzhangella sp. LS1_29]|uniref:Putative 4-hydroxy-4-methyl-2-oxoglutarate aldolase n=1 Tax=Lipingzhangella rawalii TaxID=2055835 RepID=A0ABU2HB91_9ACTN|nr:hypothetical protein [Lipingzhangella rawalii]MDS1272594.1 hypothetical protein [Lipingzhangella rawalii]
MQIVHNDVKRPSPDVIDRYEKVLLTEYSPSCLVSDAHPEVKTIGRLHMVDHRHKVVGPALTVNLRKDNLADCMAVLPRANPGDVIVIAAHNASDLAIWGGLMTTLSMMAGVAGSVVDGLIRDVDELRELDYPIWYRSTQPRRVPPPSPDRPAPIQVNVPVIIDGQTIDPGDIVVADENGLGIVPVPIAGEVLAGASALLDKEQQIRYKLDRGVTLPELLSEFGHL